MYNPLILNSEELQIATDHDILVALYQYVVAGVSLFFGLIILYIVFKTAVWFLPKFWTLRKDNL